VYQVYVIFWSSQIGHYYDDELISLYNSTACTKPLCCELWHMLLVYSLVRQLDGLHIYSLIVHFIFSYSHKCWNNKGSEILLTNASNLDEDSLSARGAGTFSVWFIEVICSTRDVDTRKVEQGYLITDIHKRGSYPTDSPCSYKIVHLWTVDGGF